jgi:hypothetical protein
MRRALGGVVSLALGCSPPLTGMWEDKSGKAITFRGDHVVIEGQEIPYKVVDADPKQLYFKANEEWIGFATFKVTPTKLTLCLAKVYERTLGGIPLGVSRVEMPTGLTGDCDTLSRKVF